MIYVTHLAPIPDYNFARLGSVLVATSPHLKAPYKEESPIFQVIDILRSGSEIKHDIICIFHPYRTK